MQFRDHLDEVLKGVRTGSPHHCCPACWLPSPCPTGPSSCPAPSCSLSAPPLRAPLLPSSLPPQPGACPPAPPRPPLFLSLAAQPPLHSLSPAWPPFALLLRGCQQTGLPITHIGVGQILGALCPLPTLAPWLCARPPAPCPVPWFQTCWCGRWNMGLAGWEGMSFQWGLYWEIPQ